MRTYLISPSQSYLILQDSAFINNKLLSTATNTASVINAVNNIEIIADQSDVIFMGNTGADGKEVPAIQFNNLQSTNTIKMTAAEKRAILFDEPIKYVGSGGTDLEINADPANTSATGTVVFGSGLETQMDFNQVTVGRGTLEVNPEFTG